LGDFGAIQQHYRPGLVSNMSLIEKAAKLRGLSIQSIFLAIYARLHAQTFGNSDNLVVGLYLANRSFVTEGLSELVAPTINIVPLRLDNKIHSGDNSIFSAAGKIQDDISLISMIEHSCVSLVEIAEWTGVRINTCINFLRLPEVKDSTDTSASQVIFKSVSYEEIGNSDGAKLNNATPSLTNGNTAAPAFTQVMRAATSTAAMRDVFWVSELSFSIRVYKWALMQLRTAYDRRGSSHPRRPIGLWTLRPRFSTGPYYRKPDD
jgi:hypothetical protein